MNHKPWQLNFWETGEYQVIREHYDDFRKAGVMISPQRSEITRALRETSYDQCKVVVFGQDPYPDPAHSTGIAFSIPDDVVRERYPPTLKNLLKEYQHDLHYPDPKCGSLVPWAHQGVLLQNVIPSCTAFSSMSHDWPEWEFLNAEIIQRLNEKPEGKIVFAFLGTVARRYAHLVDSRHKSMLVSHPSPRALLSSKVPFVGSRFFSTINTYLKEPVNWRLP